MNPRLELIAGQRNFWPGTVAHIFYVFVAINGGRKRGGHGAFNREPILDGIGEGRVQADGACGINGGAKPQKRKTQTNGPTLVAFGGIIPGKRSCRCWGLGRGRVGQGCRRGGRGEWFERNAGERIRQTRRSNKDPSGIPRRCRREVRSRSAGKVHGYVLVPRRHRDLGLRASRTRSRKEKHRHRKELFHSSLLENRRPEPGEGLSVTVNNGSGLVHAHSRSDYVNGTGGDSCSWNPRTWERLFWASASVAQIVVGFVQPIFPRWIEDVEVDGVFEGPGFVGHVRRDAQDFACAYDDFFSVDGEFQRAFKDVGDLFVVVMMQRDVGAFFHDHAGQHDLVTNDHFAIDQRIQFFAFDFIPRNVFENGGRAHFVPP